MREFPWGPESRLIQFRRMLKWLGSPWCKHEECFNSFEMRMHCLRGIQVASNPKKNAKK